MGPVVTSILEAAAPRSKSLIVSLLGDSIKPRGGAFWLGTLISACEPFDINERAVRTSVQRLSRDGWLQSERVGRKSRYALTREGGARIDQASPRMYSPPIEAWDGTWTVAFAPPGSLQAWERSQLRKYLEWEGYTMAASGVFLHPLGSADSLNEILGELNLANDVFVFSARSIEAVSALGLCDGVVQFWDLNEASDRYLHFLSVFDPVARQLGQAPGEFSDMDLFQIRLLAIHAFRRASLHAPRLPAALYPNGWPGLDAYHLCKKIYSHSWQAAEQYLDRLYAEQEERPKPPSAYFYTRFGGLAAHDDEGALSSAAG